MINSKKKVYQEKMDSLLKSIESSAEANMNKSIPHDCFISYAWSNSQDAVTDGTR